jgi:hypothetical protein
MYNTITDFFHAPVSMLKGLRSNEVTEILTLKDVLNKVKKGDLLEGERLQRLYSEESLNYTIQKEQLPAFIVGQFSQRLDNACVKYVPLMVFDIDSISDEFNTELFIKDFERIPYVMCAFASPSRHGIRVMIATNGVLENHKHNYEFLLQQFSSDSGILIDKALRAQAKAEGQEPTTVKAYAKAHPHLDSSCSNVSRLWFFTPQPEQYFYGNSKAVIFKFPQKEDVLPTAIAPIKPVAVAKKNEFREITDQDRINIVRYNLEKARIYPSNGRNNYLFCYILGLLEHNLNLQAIENEAFSMEEKDFTKEEINRIFNSARAKHTKTFSHAQIATYLNNAGSKIYTRNIDSDIPVTLPIKAEKLDTDNVVIHDQESTEDLEDDEDFDEEEGGYNKHNNFNLIRNYLDTRYDIRLNIISLDIEVSKKNKGKYEILNEADLLCEMLEKGFKQADRVLSAILRSSRYVERYDPFKAYFESLEPWDQQTDYIKELTTYIKTTDQPWFEKMFEKHLIRTAAGATGFLEFNKHCFVFKSEQNNGKSSFVRHLMPPELSEYIAENPDLESKDGRVAICQNLVINLDELASLSKTDLDKLKSVFTMGFVKERLPYERKPEKITRRASFFGSINRDEFLTDETGNVRWLIFEVKKINHDFGGQKGYAAVDINRVWAQAYALAKRGSSFYNMNAEEIAKNEENNSPYMVTTIESNYLQEIFRHPKSNDINVFVTASHILSILETRTKQRLTVQSIGRAMRILNFERTQMRIGKSTMPMKGYKVVFNNQSDFDYYRKLFGEDCTEPITDIFIKKHSLKPLDGNLFYVNYNSANQIVCIHNTNTGRDFFDAYDNYIIKQTKMEMVA